MAGLGLGAEEEGEEPTATVERSDAEDKVVRYSFTTTATRTRADAAMRDDRLEKRRPGEPLHLGGLPEESLRKLQYAYPRALDKVREVEACERLFEGMGKDGVEVLSRTAYGPPVSEEERRMCEDRDALAVTTVGGSRTVLCDAFGRYDRETATRILIHEALHAAGMTEKPGDPDALSSHEINRLVSASCAL